MNKYRKAVLWIIVIVLLAAAGSGYVYYRQASAAPLATEEPDVQTATVRRGSLVVSASGSGTVIAATEIELAFQQSGRLSELAVQVGDSVKSGDVLATLESSESAAALQLQLSTAQLAVLKAQQTLDALYDPTDVTLAQSESDLLTAQTTLNDLLLSRQGMNYQNCSDAVTDVYRKIYENAVKNYEASPTESAFTSVSTALDNLNYCLEPASGIPAADAEIQLSRAQIAELQREIEQLKAGPDPDDIALAQAELENAKDDLAVTQEEIEKHVLIAPMDGVVTAVNANVGDTVSTSAILTLANLNHPMLEIYVDETDLSLLRSGYEVEVVFDALPDETFSGKVIRVDPSLVASGNVQAVRGIVQLDDPASGEAQTLPIGLNASIEVIASRAENALLVPVEALREISTGKYGVFVMENGQPKLKMVEVGLMDVTYAEIKAGLNEGDVVTTGVVETGK